MENFIITITYLVIGMILRRIPRFHEETGNVLSLFVIYVSLPALVLLKVPELTISRELLVPALMPWVMLLLSSVLILFLSRLLKWERQITGCLLLMVPLGNTSFLGIPMVKAFFGDHAIPYALLYDQLGSFLALATYGSLILAIYGREETKPTVRDVGIKIITFPPFIFLILAFLLKGVSYPDVVTSILKVLSSTLVPLVMVAVGFQLTLRLSKESTSPLCIGLCIKLLAAPLCALLLCKLAGLEGEAVQVAIFEAGMPPMVSAGALAILASLAPSLTAALVGLGIFLSFATLPVIFQFL
jgi:predicted permease